MTRPSPAGRRAITACLVLLLVTSLSGCAGLARVTTPQPPLPGPDEARERALSLETLDATVRTVQHAEDGTTTTVSAVKQRFDPSGYRSRTRSVESNTTGRTYASEGTLVITNETTSVLYRPEEQSVSYMTSPDRDREYYYLDVLAAARANETIQRPTPGVPALPRVPRDDAEDEDEGEASGNGSTSYRDQLVGVRYNGTERVDGRQTYRLEVGPVSPNASLEDQTLWLDTEYLYPLRRHVEFVRHGDRYEYRTTYRNVTFNPDLPPGTFRFDRDRLPAAVEETRFRSYDSREALAANVSMPVPDPNVPEGYELDRASYRSDDPTVVTLTYERRADEPPIRIWVNDDDRYVSADGTAVSVGTRTAWLARANGTTWVEWTADGYGYTVQGPVDNGTLVRIARSVAATT